MTEIEQSIFGGNSDPEYLKHLSNIEKLELKNTADVEKIIGELLFCRNKLTDINRKIKTEYNNIIRRFKDETDKLQKQIFDLEFKITAFYIVYPGERHDFDTAEIIDKHIIKVKPKKSKPSENASTLRGEDRGGLKGE